MIIGCDIDGVVADFASTAEAWMCDRFGYEPVEVNCWNWFEQHPDGGKMAWRALWNTGVAQEEILRNCEPVEGAIEGLQSLLNWGAEVVFVTHRSPRYSVQTVDWLQRHGLPCNLAFLKDKSLLGADFYVDDKPETVRGLLDSGLDAVLFEQPWNFEETPSLPSVHGWKNLVWSLTAEFNPETLS